MVGGAAVSAFPAVGVDIGAGGGDCDKGRLDGE